jgi:hypothetical protein
MAEFRQVDPNLVGASCLEPACQQGLTCKMVKLFDVRDCLFANIGKERAAAPAVAPVTHQPAGDPLRVHHALRHGEIPPKDGVGAELLAQACLGCHSSGEDDQAAGFFVQPLHDPEPGQRASSAFALPRRDHRRHQVFQRRMQRLSPGRPGSLRGMADRRQAGRFFNYYQVLVEMAKSEDFMSGRWADWLGQQLDGLTFTQSSGGVEAQIAVDTHLSARDQVPNSGPRQARQPAAQKGSQGLAGVFRRYGE